MWAKYFDVDPLLVRIAFVIATFLSGGLGILLYLVLAIVMPRDDAAKDDPADGIRENLQGIFREASEAGSRVAQGFQRSSPSQAGGGQAGSGEAGQKVMNQDRRTEAGGLAKEIAEEVRVHLEAHRDLGAQYEDDVVDSLIRNIESALDARLGSKASKARGSAGPSAGRRMNLGLLAVAMALGIPLTAVAGSMGGVAGVTTVWGALVFLVLYFDRRR